MAKKKLSADDKRLIAYALECLAQQVKHSSRDTANSKAERKMFADMQADCVRLMQEFSEGGE